MNKAFNKLHQQKQMHWSTDLSFTFSVFIVWKTIMFVQDIATWKNCVVVNIWNLNKISISDNYLLSLQSDVTAAVWEVSYIITVNCTEFFY